MNTISTLKLMNASVVNSFTLKHFRPHLMLMLAFILSAVKHRTDLSNLFLVEHVGSPAVLRLSPLNAGVVEAGEEPPVLMVQKPVVVVVGHMPVPMLLL
ncbi:MAG: hypothetical protein IPP46_03450 [Bacteroidetes bacterium]|nr:hypothetical protein [Bacteroidota bacterium]